MKKEEHEKKYGELGSAGKVLFIQGKPVAISHVQKKLGLDYEDIVSIDCKKLPESGCGNAYFLRVFDGEERRIAVFEFDDDFKILKEERTDIVEWMGDEYFSHKWKAFCPGDPERWLGEDATKKRR